MSSRHSGEGGGRGRGGGVFFGGRGGGGRNVERGGGDRGGGGGGRRAGFPPARGGGRGRGGGGGGFGGRGRGGGGFGGGRGGGRRHSFERGGGDRRGRGGRGGPAPARRGGRGHGEEGGFGGGRGGDGGPPRLAREGGGIGGRAREGRGGRGGGFNWSETVSIEPHEHHEAVFIARRNEEYALVTVNLAPGSHVYGEKRITVENEEKNKIEYRVWDPFTSKLAAAIEHGVSEKFMPPGAKVLYLGAATGTTVSHVADVVGPEGLVYAVEKSHEYGRELLKVAVTRANIVPIIEDPDHPDKYRMLIGMVQTIIVDVKPSNQAITVAIKNAQYFLKDNGHFVLFINVDVRNLWHDRLQIEEQIHLAPYSKSHQVVVGAFQ